MPTFPVPQWTGADYHISPRAFGSSRSKGKRLHAGCDLYAALGSPVRAIAPGRVVKAGMFYCETFAVEVDHGTLGIVRYGEVSPKLAKGIVAGALVEEGQTIGYIGHLVGLHCHPMLHFELYSGKGSGPLTVYKGSKYQRRDDLMDPTPMLDRMVASMATVANEAYLMNHTRDL